MAGIYIHPNAAALLRHNDVQGLMMDTTWSVMPHYVTSILVAVKNNTVIPIAFSFGATESVQLYQRFYELFEEKWGINLGDYPVLCDQGSARAKICKDNENRRFLCLHHFLKTITDPFFNTYVKNLVRCRTREEFLRMVTLLESYLPVAIGNSTIRLKAALVEFAKAGLIIRIGLKIEIDPDRKRRWEEVSQYVRVQWRMSPTTNSLESIHGHLNEATPRRNNFWASLKRLADHIDEGMERSPDAVRHNFNHAWRVSLSRISKIGEDELQDQIRTFQSTSEGCPCGETVHVSAMYGCMIPCCHMIQSGATRPRMPLPLVFQRFELDHQVGLTVTIQELERVRGPLDQSRVQSLQKMATGSIHHTSRTRRTKGEVEQWVKDHWPTGAAGSYLLGIPDTVVFLILIGVTHFSLAPFSQRAGEFMGGPSRRRSHDGMAEGVED
jgi:hypothetical protein